jgi:hypothetical protein
MIWMMDRVSTAHVQQPANQQAFHAYNSFCLLFAPLSIATANQQAATIDKGTKSNAMLSKGGKQAR